MKVHVYDDVIQWKHFPRYRPFVRGIRRSPVNSLHRGQWRGALMFSFICVWINGWINIREAGDLRRYRAHYDVIVMNAERILKNLDLAHRYRMFRNGRVDKCDFFRFEFWLTTMTIWLPSHYLRQCWNIANWTLRNKLKWIFNRDTSIFIEENTFENVVCEVSAILFRPRCVNHLPGVLLFSDLVFLFWAGLITKFFPMINHGFMIENCLFLVTICFLYAASWFKNKVVNDRKFALLACWRVVHASADLCNGLTYSRCHWQGHFP